MATGSTAIPKWQLALIVGTPVLIGVCYYIYKNGKKSEEVKDKKSNADCKSVKTSKPKAVEEQLTPFRQAIKYKDEGNVRFRKGKYDEAISLYDAAIEICPIENKADLAIFYQNRSAAYEMFEKWSQVISDCTKSIQLNKRYTKAYFRRAKAYEQSKDLLSCLDDLTATCILECFQNQTTIMYADRILKQTGLEESLKIMKDRVPILPSSSFIKTYFRSFVMDPLNLEDTVKAENPRGYLKAKLAFSEGRFDDVLMACTEEIEESESEAQYKSEALLLRATFYLLSGRYVEAKTDLDALIQNTEIDVNLRVNALIKRAALFVQIDEKDLGMEDFKSAENLNPENADIYHQRAQIYILLDQLYEALLQFEKTITIAPNHAMAFVQKCYADYRLAFLSQDHGRLLAVMNEFKNVMEKFPDCVDCYSLMAQVLSEQGQFAEADQFFETAIKKAPDAASIYVHRGIMELQWTGDIEKALQYMNKSIEIDEKCELAYETLGTIEVQRANLLEAVKLFETALKYAKGPSEMAHLCSLKIAALAQYNVTQIWRLNG